jgi:integrase
MDIPYPTDAIQRGVHALKVLGIDDLHFHDLRHEGVSRLFEIGRSIPQAASVSGHQSWSSLKRYAHMRQTGDKYAATWRHLLRLRHACALGTVLQHAMTV